MHSFALPAIISHLPESSPILYDILYSPSSPRSLQTLTDRSSFLYSRLTVLFVFSLKKVLPQHNPTRAYFSSFQALFILKPTKSTFHYLHTPRPFNSATLSTHGAVTLSPAATVFPTFSRFPVFFVLMAKKESSSLFLAARSRHSAAFSFDKFPAQNGHPLR